MYYYRARYYDARAGRFISEDPIGFAGGDVNLYVYVGNDPVNKNDPSGTSPLAEVFYKYADKIPAVKKAAEFIMNEIWGDGRPSYKDIITSPWDAYQRGVENNREIRFSPDVRRCHI